jgi:hypothetical protein
MEFNLISRISEDKNFFVDLIYVIYRVKTEYDTVVKLNFIGAISSEGVYRMLVRLIDLLELNDQVNFTKISIRYEDLSDEVKKGYFINLTVGNFIGYSGIECMKYNLKAIFYNVHEIYERYMEPNRMSFCSDRYALIELIKAISLDADSINDILYAENKRLYAKYLLSTSEADLLKSTMI